MDVYQPLKGSSSKLSKSSHVEFLHTVLLHAPQTGNLNVPVMADYMQGINEIVISTIPVPKPASLPSGCGIIIQFRIPKIDPGYVKIAVSPPEGVNAIPVTALYEAIYKLPVSDGFVYRDHVEFQLCYSCWSFKWDGAYPPRSLQI